MGSNLYDGIGRACAPHQITGEHDPKARAPHRRNAMVVSFLAASASAWGVLMGLSPVLQIRRMLRQRSSREVSLGYFAILLAGFVLWLPHRIAARSLSPVGPHCRDR